ncbi:MAG: fimbrillin family protein [Bacteroidales bacterium]
MKKRLFFKVISLVCIFCTLSIQGCEEDQTSVNRIQFKSDNLRLSSTKSVFQSGNICDIHIIHSGTRTFYTGGSPLYGQSDNYGNINPYNPVYLENGLYDFYLLSINDSQSPFLTFNNGYSANLNNGFDYLWSGMKGVTVAGDKTLSFNFKRLSCRIELNVKSSTSIKNMVVKKVEFALPNTAGYLLDLISGNVQFNSGEGDLTVIGGSGNGRLFTMLPKSGTTEVAVEIDGEINGSAVYSKRFTTQINPDFLPGIYYLIDLEIEHDPAINVKIQLSPWRLTVNENIFNLNKKSSL